MTKDSLSYKIDTIFFCNAGPCKQKWQAEIFKNTSIFSNNDKKKGGGVKRERYIQAHELCTHYNSVAFILSSILQVMKKKHFVDRNLHDKKISNKIHVYKHTRYVCEDSGCLGHNFSSV